MVKPNFEEFAFRGADDTDLRDRLAVMTAGRQRFYAPTGAGDEHIGDQRLATFVTTPTEVAGPEAIIRATAFSDDNGRDSGAVFDALIADATGRRVIAVNTPGVDFSETMDPSFIPQQELTYDQLKALKKGEEGFRKVGGSMMRAIDHAAAYWDIPREYILSASSMGIAVGAGMLEKSFHQGYDIKGVALAEPVNHIRRALPKFGNSFLKSGADQVGYLQMNPAPLRELDEGTTLGIPVKWLERVVEDRQANWAYVRAMAKGTFYADLGKIDGLEFVPTYITHGAGSQLSPAEPFEQFVDHFASRRKSTDNLQSETFGNPDTNPHNHPYTMTVQSVIDGVNKVIELGL